MKAFFQQHWDTILKIFGFGFLLFILNRVARIFKGKDGEFQILEFCKFAAFVIFTTLACYMIWMEAHRTHEYQMFDTVYVIIVFGSLLSVLHMDHVITNISKIFELIVRIRMKTPLPGPEVPKEEPGQQPLTATPKL